MPMIWEGGGYYCYRDVRLHFGFDCIFVEKGQGTICKVNYILELNVYLWKKVKVQFVKYNSYYSL